MGRIKNKTVKRASREMIEKYYYKLTEDFHFNKKIMDTVAEVPSKRLRNKIAGFTTHLMRRIQKGPVKGISLKIQEEQREKMFDVIPAESKIQIGKTLEVDRGVLKMLESQGFEGLIKNRMVAGKSIM